MKEDGLREKVKTLKSFYEDVASYVFVNLLLISIWFIFDNPDTFWPKYILVLWGIALIFKAYRKGIFPLILTKISFLTPEWEERKVSELMGRHKGSQRKISLKRDKKMSSTLRRHLTKSAH